ncbi:hypothetical protein [Burkholderia lata]|uniref:hypothetical protein n=1 Tax=Burkholderia lata (strain ATCC 17760 / DSM 23089 / LMG 22485 / NCIMB 9086 / R18194 / 383) TaxID=482957 RepID=UPI0015821B21|nr:hypothetical protein [Burkholderia lata]
MADDASTAVLPASAGTAMAALPHSTTALASKAVVAARMPRLQVASFVLRACRIPPRFLPADEAGSPSPPGGHGRPVCRFKFMSETVRRPHRERRVLSSFLIVPQLNQLRKELKGFRRSGQTGKQPTNTEPRMT